MLHEVYKCPPTWVHLRSGPLGQYVEGFVAEERALGFARLTIHGHLRVVAALNRWLDGMGLQVADLSETRISEFLQSRRSSCRRHEKSPLRRFLIYLRDQGAVQRVTVETRNDPHMRLLRQYGEHLTKVRGLTAPTVTRYQSIARSFLHTHVPSGSTRFRDLTGTSISSFVVAVMRCRGRKAAKELIVGLRAFLRWLQFRGWIASNLVSAVPAVADWRLSSLPPALTAHEVRRVLRSCNRHTPVGLRDFAILLLIARLGIRAGEVVRLKLEDIDWRSGELMLQRKPDRQERVPLPVDVGAALSAYLKSGRPVCSDRHVFLCMNAPHRSFRNSSTVTCVVAAALRRAGLNPERKGTHLLRHTLARRLLQKGATLSEIGDLLGHRHIAATEIYAKVDFKALRSVAQPWPGGYR